MAKGKLLEDTFEQLAELGSSTAKKTVKQVVQTLNPLASTDKQTGNKQDQLDKKDPLPNYYDEG